MDRELFDELLDSFHKDADMDMDAIETEPQELPFQDLTFTPLDQSMLEPKQLREKNGMKVDEFARAVGVSVSLVRSWESKRRTPSGSALKLLQLMHLNPLLCQQLLDAENASS